MVETGSGDHALELAARLGAKWVYNITISPIQSFENVLNAFKLMLPIPWGVNGKFHA
jgi:hypothetical protein